MNANDFIVAQSGGQVNQPYEQPQFSLPYNEPSVFPVDDFITTDGTNDWQSQFPENESEWFQLDTRLADFNN